MYGTTQKGIYCSSITSTTPTALTKGTRFTIRKDHNSLTRILKLTDITGQLARWRLLLFEFEFVVLYKPGMNSRQRMRFLDYVC